MGGGSSSSVTATIPHHATDLFVMNADGSGQRNLTHTPNVSEHTASWAPAPAREAARQAAALAVEHAAGKRGGNQPTLSTSQASISSLVTRNESLAPRSAGPRSCARRCRATTRLDRCRLSTCQGAPISVRERSLRRPPQLHSSIVRRCAGSPRTAPRGESRPKHRAAMRTVRSGSNLNVEATRLPDCSGMSPERSAVYAVGLPAASSDT